MVAPDAARAADPIAGVPLGLVETFGVLTPAAVGNAAPEPATVLRGDVGAGGALTGFPPGIITGDVFTGSVDIAPMMTDLQAAYDNAAGRPAGTALPADFGGSNFGPGVHTTAAAAGTAALGAFTIDAAGDPDAVFIFQVGGALALGANTTMTLINDAQAKNVFWQVVGAGSIGANTQFVGTLIAGTAVSAGAGSTVNGRLTSLTGAITMSSTQLYSGPPSVSIDGGATTYTTDPTPLVTGTTSARSPMTVSISIDGVEQFPAIVPSATGIWTFESPLLANGDHTIVASSVDGAGNLGSASQTITVDTTPPTVTIDGGEIAVTNDVTPTISGTTDIAAGQIVTLTLTRATTPLSFTRTALVQADQTWSIAPTGFTTGEWTIVALVADPAGNETTASQVLTVDATAPVAAITSSALTNDPTPTITGSAEVGATIAVSIDGLALADVVQGANWSATTTAALGHGDHNVSVTATDVAGNATLLTQTLAVDLVAPVVSIVPGPTDSTNDTTPTIVGTSDVAIGTTVSVTIDGGAPRTALVNADGWNITPSTSLTAGDHTIVASVTDPAGNVGTATQTLTIDTSEPTVIIDGGSSRSTGDATPAITGSSPDVPVGSDVTVEVAGQTLTTTIAIDGTFSTTAAAITPNGTYFVLVTVTDEAGNDGDANQSLTITAIPPTVAFTNGSVAATNDTTPLISGTTDAPVGSLVVVEVNAQILNATVQPGGSWNVTAAAMAPGDATVTASITDPDGNVGTASQTLTVDATTPTTIVITGGASRSTNDDTPTISGTTDAADGRTITVTVAGQTLEVSATAGTWTATATTIADGTYQVTATASAIGGNPGSATQSITIDTVEPVVVIGGGDGTVQTTDPTPQISGSGATPGSTVTVVVAGQTMTTTVGSDGTWSVTPSEPLPPGDNPVTVTITDPAGNAGTGSQTVTVVAVVTTVTITGGATAATSDATPTVSGTTNAADGRALTVNVSTQTLTTTVVGGVWSVDVANLADGTYNVTASVGIIDGTPAASSQELTIDTAAPVVVLPPVVETTDSTPDITGSGTEPGSTVVVTVTGQTLTTTVEDDGTWSVTPTSPLPAGSNAVTVTITDPAGNTTTGSQTVNVATGSTPPSTVRDYTPVGPKRVFDTRSGSGEATLRDVAKRKISGGYELTVQMTDLAGFVPDAGVGAVSLNVTATGSTTSGFVTVYACGARRDVSSVNFAAGKTVANAVVTPVSASGTVCFYSSAATDIIVDVNGWFADGAAFNAVGPERVFDTRVGASPGALRSVPKTKLGAGQRLEVRVTDLAGHVPTNGVGAVSLNVTITNPEAAGFVTVDSCGTLKDVSSVNYASGQTIANAVIVPVSASGTVCLFTYAKTDIIVDINGWIASGSSFHGVGPARVLDTRAGNGSTVLRTVTQAKIGGGRILQVQVSDLAGHTPASGVDAVSLNVTATGTEGPGFITVFACGAMEGVSSLNYDTGATVANAVIAPVSDTGAICLFSNQLTDVIVDINGWIGTA